MPGSGPILKVDKLAFQSPWDLFPRLWKRAAWNCIQMGNTGYEFRDFPLLEADIVSQFTKTKQSLGEPNPTAALVAKSP